MKHKIKYFSHACSSRGINRESPFIWLSVHDNVKIMKTIVKHFSPSRFNKLNLLSEENSFEMHQTEIYERDYGNRRSSIKTT